MRHTKIVCTIGPSSESPEVLERMLAAGMNVARLNFSHGTHEEHGKKIEALRALSKQKGVPIAILQDLAGPKIRTGAFACGSIQLAPGDAFTLTARPVPGDQREVSLTYADLPRDVQAGDTLLLADGALEMKVEAVQGPDIRCRVVTGGTLSNHKGINLPSRSIRAPILGEKDKADLAFGLQQGVDYVALSFVRSAADIQVVLDFMARQGRSCPLIAKIEKHEALADLDNIIAAVDGVMVARGDLGVDIPLEQVPGAQRQIIAKANRAGKPVITATQMLKSMTDAPRPTRAEVTDVANAVLEGTDAVMLSEETASGQYPVEAVGYMARTALETEKAFPYLEWTHKFDGENLGVQEGVAKAACGLAEDLGSVAIITATQSGSTTRQVAKYRPPIPILAATPDAHTYQRLALVWGCLPVMIHPAENYQDLFRTLGELAQRRGLVQKGRTAIITAGLPLHVAGITNIIWVESF